MGRGGVGRLATRCFESRIVQEVGADEAVLLLRGGIFRGVDSVGMGVVVVVAPFILFASARRFGVRGCFSHKMVGKFVAWKICVCIFKVDDDELFVLVGRKKER